MKYYDVKALLKIRFQNLILFRWALGAFFVLRGPFSGAAGGI